MLSDATCVYFVAYSILSVPSSCSKDILKVSFIFSLPFLLLRLLFILLFFYLFISITQARLRFHMMAVIYTDMGLNLECLPQISRQPYLMYSAKLRS